MPDGPARIAQLKTMNALIDDDAPLFALWDPLRFGVFQKWVSNFKRNPLTSENAFLRVDMAAKKKGP